MEPIDEGREKDRRRLSGSIENRVDQLLDRTAEQERRIDRLTRLRDHLNGCIGCGCLSVRDCPLHNPFDRLAEEGPGPRLLDPE